MHQKQVTLKRPKGIELLTGRCKPSLKSDILSEEWRKGNLMTIYWNISMGKTNKSNFFPGNQEKKIEMPSNQMQSTPFRFGFWHLWGPTGTGLELLNILGYT